MPAINVARTDTFEKQRLKINEIGSQIFSISEGGSDLSTGILKLGDGTKSIPSLSFTSAADLGFYKSDIGRIGVVSNNKNIIDFETSLVQIYKNFTFTKKELTTDGLVKTNSGSGYDFGTYTDIALQGGSGAGAIISVDVISFNGTITNNGLNYNAGSFNTITIVGGNGSGATASFSVDGIDGQISNTGSGYTDGNYTDVPLQGGNGSNATANIDVGEGEIGQCEIVLDGQNYINGDVLTVNASDVGGTGSGFQYTISTTPGTIQNFVFEDQGSGYQEGDVLNLPGNITGVTGNTNGQVAGVSTTLSDVSATITVASTTGILPGMSVNTEDGSVGNLAEQTTVQSVDSATEITLSTIPNSPGAASLLFASIGALNEIVVSSVAGLVVNSTITVTSGTGSIPVSSVVDSINEEFNTITTSEDATQAGPITLSFTPPFGIGTTAWSYTVADIGVVDTFTVTNGGIGYDVGDQLSVSNTLLSQPITYTVTASNLTEIILQGTVSSSAYTVGNTITITTGEGATDTIIRQIYASGGNIDSMLVDVISTTNGDSISGGNTVDTSTDTKRFFIDTGSGAVITPDITLYVGSKYIFDTTQLSSHAFLLSKFRDGSYSPSIITGVSTTLSDSSNQITVISTTGILAGMSVSTAGGTGSLEGNTTVASVIDATTIQLSDIPSVSGTATLDFTGNTYEDGVQLTGSGLEITVNENTPSLYYYCANHPDMGGKDNDESTITINQNNPKVFGSGFLLTSNEVNTQDIISNNIDTGTIEAIAFTGSAANFSGLTVSGTGTVQTLTVSNSISTPSITSSSNINVNTSSFDINASVSIGSNFAIDKTTGDLATTGELKTTDSLNINDKLLITNSVISSAAGQDIEMTPATGKIAKVNGTTAFKIPSGNTADRPATSLDGYIRFNTETAQYEGYSASSTSWSSLGGVRDLDGNTYIVAEETVGANDNTLYFFNDATNTIKLTPSFLDFRSVKKISSGKLGLPTFNEWTSNTPVAIDDYIKYKNNLYKITGAGTTASSGSEPTHVSGDLNNGTAQFSWYSSAVDPLTFEEISELRIGPNKDCPLIIGQELKLDDNTISTQVQDLIIKPNAGKQVIVDSVTHFRIPSGNNNERSIAAANAGSIRFNTDILQFEGYSGANWSSLGGVRDVDGNTYIIPETAPAANENILYFYNNNVNTIQLTETVLDFTSIDTITTSGGTNLALDTQTLTLNSNATTIDNSDSTRTFISTTKQYLDIGLSSGLNTDPVLRLDDQGDIFFNTTFGSGSFNGVKIFDGELKEFELADYKISSATFTLDKGGLESSSAVLYDSTTSKGCKVTVVSKSDSGKRSMVEYSVIDNGTDIFFSEYASLNTSSDQFTSAFDFTSSTEPRITVTLTDDHTIADIINFTILIQELK
jgi:hypothetical protein